MKASYKNIITIEPGKRSGQPTIRGMRITVTDVLQMLASGMSEKEILVDFPMLTKNDIRAAREFARGKGVMAHIGLREYTAVFKKSGKWIVAWVEEVPGAMTQGRTKKEARENLREALTLILKERAKLSKEDMPIERENIHVNVRNLITA